MTHPTRWTRCLYLALLVCAVSSCDAVPDESRGVDTPAVASKPQDRHAGAGTRLPEDAARSVTHWAGESPTAGDPATDSTRLAAYRCVDMASCEGNVFGAASEAEAAWLAQNGYPSPQDDARYAGMSTDALEAAARGGDVLACTYLGQRLVESGNAMDGLGWLYRASLNGSVHASYAFAEAFATDRSIMSITESTAYYKLAFLQGDRKAIDALVTQFPQLTTTELVQADKRAMTLYNGLLSAKVRERKTIRIAPRP